MNDQQYNAIKAVALRMFQQLPSDKLNSPQVQTILQAIQNDDHETGQRIASNFCQSYGVTKEQGINNALSMFGFNKK